MTAQHRYSTPQEAFWAGDFGTAYIDRNQSEGLIASKTALFARALARTHTIGSVLELGPNAGLNLIALSRLLPEAGLSAVEINQTAYEIIKALPGVNAHHASLLDWHSDDRFDLTFTSGVLIHIDPDALPRAYDTLYRHSRRYIALFEYYNPAPVVVPYRGNADRLFKRDFAGDMMERYPDLSLVDYGFVYRRDPVFPGDDITWFMLEKRS